MDIQIILIGVAVFVLSALLIYLISVFGIKEKSFEEAIAEQKRRIEEEKEKARSDKKAEREKKKTTYKRSKEKPKEKGHQVSESELHTKEPKMVNLEIDPEIIEPLEANVSESKKPNKKTKPAKPILSNKDEKPRVSTKTQEVIHHVPLPKDEVELKHDHEEIVKEKHQQPSKAQKKSEKNKEEKKVPVEEQIIVEKQSALQSAMPPANEDKRMSKMGPMKPNQLMAAVHSASLSDSELQNMIDILLDKQGGASSAWNKKTQKGDAVTILRKQLEEKERTLQEEQKLAMQANANLMKERANYSSLEKQYQEKIAVQDQEIQGLRSRMQQSLEQNMIERSNMQSRLQQLERQAGDQSVVQKLSEENKMLKENLDRTKSESVSQKEYTSLTRQLQIIQDELSKNVVKANASDNAKKSLEDKLAKAEEELKKLRGSEKESDSILSKRLEDVNKQLRKAEAENATVKGNLKTAEKECTSMKTRLQELEKTLSGNDSNFKELEEKLKGAEKEKVTVQSTLKTTEKKLADVEQQKSKLQKDFEAADREKTNLDSSLKCTEKKLADLEQEKNKLKKDAENFDKEKNTWEMSKKTSTQRLEEADILVSQLKKDVEVLKHELKVSKETAAKSSATKTETQNGDIHEETSENKIPVTQHEKLLSEKDKEIESNRAEVTKLKEELDKQKKKNNDLREKNWKAMDALQIAEKSVSEKVQSALKSAKEEKTAVLGEAETQDKAVLKRLFPDISVNEKLVHADWMSAFEKEATQVLSRKIDSKQSEDSAARVKQLEGSVSNLESQVQEYKGLLSTTSANYNTKVKELEDQNNDLQSQVTKLQSDLTNSANQNSSSSDLVESNRRLESQVQEYRDVLSTTETKLQELENSVEGEEKKWHEKLQNSKLDLEQSRQECLSLREQVEKSKETSEALTELEFAYRCLEKSLNQITDEMKEKVLVLEGQLKLSGEKSSELQQQLKESKETIITLTEKIELSKSSQSNNDDLLKQIEDLKKAVEIESKKSKELATTNVRLNGIIKTGHDALLQEQALVSKLKTEMETLNKDSGKSASAEIKELKVKLEEKEKQLEKEMTAKKQLSQRLVQTESSDTSASQ